MTRWRSSRTLGICRRGYFIEGLGGAQFALPGAVERLRAQATSTALRRSCSPPATRRSRSAPRCRGRRRRASAGEGRRAARVAGAHVGSSAPRLPATSRPAAAACKTFVSGEPLRIALSALADAVRGGRIRKLELERVDGEPVLGSGERAACWWSSASAAGRGG